MCRLDGFDWRLAAGRGRLGQASDRAADHASSAGLRISVLRSVRRRLHAAAGNDVEHAFDPFESSGNHKSVAIVALATTRGMFGATLPMRLQRAVRVTPTNEIFESFKIGRLAGHAAERAAFVFDSYQLAHAGLTRSACVFQTVDVVAVEIGMLVVEQAFEFGKQPRLIAHEASEMIAAKSGVQILGRHRKLAIR